MQSFLHIANLNPRLFFRIRHLRIFPFGFALKHALRLPDPHVLYNPEHGGKIEENIRTRLAMKRLKRSPIFISITPFLLDCNLAFQVIYSFECLPTAVTNSDFFVYVFIPALMCEVSLMPNLCHRYRYNIVPNNTLKY